MKLPFWTWHVIEFEHWESLRYVTVDSLNKLNLSDHLYDYCVTNGYVKPIVGLFADKDLYMVPDLLAKRPTGHFSFLDLETFGCY